MPWLSNKKLELYLDCIQSQLGRIARHVGRIDKTARIALAEAGVLLCPDCGDELERVSDSPVYICRYCTARGPRNREGL